MGEKGQATGGSPAGATSDASQVDPSLVDTSPGESKGPFNLPSPDDLDKLAAAKLAGPDPLGLKAPFKKIAAEKAAKDAASQTGGAAGGALGSIAGAAGAAGSSATGAPGGMAGGSGEKGQLTRGYTGESEPLKASVAQQSQAQQQMSDALKKQSDTSEQVLGNLK